MNWTTQQRYTRIEEKTPQELAALQAKTAASPWRQQFHIQPETGLLNDPNGFSYYNGEYHLFYQWFPLGPVHGIKYWYHTKSTDLVHWENAGIAIRPNDLIDSHGAYSGSGIEHDGQLYLMYTGNTRDENWVRHPKQNMAVMNPNGDIQKWPQPVIDHVPDGYTDHFRDPKVWKENDHFYAVIGAQRSNETGCVVLYSSLDLEKWTFEGEIQTTLPDFGYMWECPDFFRLNEQDILIFSPQGIAPEGNRYHNIYQSGFLLGQLNLDNRTFIHNDFDELDRGFDFYAPQSMETPDGRRIVVGWMGLPELEYPTDEHGWAHCLTLPRELTVEAGHLKQRPVQELTALRGAKEESRFDLADSVQDWTTGTTYELECVFTIEDAAQCGIEFRTGAAEKTVLVYDVQAGQLTFDRSQSGALGTADYGTARHCVVTGKTVSLRLFVDVSSVEVFVNDGEHVITSRIFPREDSTGIRLFANGGSAHCHAVKWAIGGKKEWDSFIQLEKC